MGMSIQVEFGPSTGLSWNKLVGQLGKQGIAIEMRMIDGEIAFPTDEPTEDWKELRVSHSGAMLTIRRQPSGIELVSWNTDDTAIATLRENLALAAACVSEGTVHCDGKTYSADKYAEVIKAAS